MKSSAVGFGCLVLIALYSTSVVLAQTERAVNVGVRGGLNLANVAAEPDTLSRSFRPAFIGGAFVEVGLFAGLSISAEAQYHQGGFVVDNFAIGGSTYKATIQFDDVRFPLILRYTFDLRDSKFRPYVAGGGSVAFNTKAEMVLDPPVRTPGIDVSSFDLADSTEATDGGLHFGAGAAYEFTPGVSLLLDGRYYLGLQDIDRHVGERGIDWKARLRNLAILLGVSYRVN